MMKWADVPQVLFEFLWPIVLLFSLALLVKSVIRRYRISRMLRFKRESLLFYTGAISTILLLVFAAVFAINPLVDVIVYSGEVGAKNGFYLFWSLLMCSLVLIALIVTRILCMAWPSVPIPDQDNKV
ncbi:MAG: hypothetical protein ACKOQY_09590 [Bacteroidota bacterium]